MRNHLIGATVDAIDLFCGVGGSSMGIQAAGAEIRAAANHSTYAIEVHSANLPGVEHFRADLLDTTADSYIHPAELPPARFLWASPSCRHHSQANAAKLYRSRPAFVQTDLFGDYLDVLGDTDSSDRYERSERSRTTMVCPWLYAQRHQPEIVIVENVVEVCHWGPNRDGSQFRDWLNQWDKIGYDHRCVFLNSGLFPPCPQSRDRIYIVFWRKGNPTPDLEHRPDAWCGHCGSITIAAQAWKPTKASWPLPRWGKYGAQYLYRCLECRSVAEPLRMPAASVINWADLGPTLAERDRPLAPKTIDRIRRGLIKFADWPAVTIDPDGRPSIAGGPADQEDPGRAGFPTVVATTASHHIVNSGVIIPAAGNTYERPGQTRARSVWDQLFAQTGTLEHGVVNVGFAKFNGEPGDTAWHHHLDQIGTITSRDTSGLVAATMPLVHANSDDRYRHALLEQLATLTTARERYMACGPAQALVELLARPGWERYIRFRMLQPDPELRGGMGFEPDFKLFGTKAQMTQGLGNAVTPPPATWLTGQALASLDEPTSQRRRSAA